MYIDPFLAGVLSTLGVEFLLVIILAFFAARSKEE